MQIKYEVIGEHAPEVKPAIKLR